MEYNKNTKSTLFQSLRRLGQQLNFSSNFECVYMQVSLAKKLYAKNGLEIVMTCSGFPEQYDVFKNGVKVAYLRLRHGCFTVEHPDCWKELLMEEEPIGDGFFLERERLIYLTKALRKILQRLDTS